MGKVKKKGELAFSQIVRVLLLHGVGKVKKKGELALSQIVRVLLSHGVWKLNNRVRTAPENPENPEFLR